MRVYTLSLNHHIVAASYRAWVVDLAQTVIEALPDLPVLDEPPRHCMPHPLVQRGSIEVRESGVPYLNYRIPERLDFKTISERPIDRPVWDTYSIQITGNATDMLEELARSFRRNLKFSI